MAIKLREDGLEFGDGSFQNTAISSNVIFMWYGSTESVPNGWALCDGTNGTPDLRDKFIIGAGNSHVTGNTGGFADSVIVQHTHSVTFVSNGIHSHNLTELEHTHGDLDFLPGGHHTHPGPYSATTPIDGDHNHDANYITYVLDEAGHTHATYFPSTDTAHTHFMEFEPNTWDHQHPFGTTAGTPDGEFFVYDPGSAPYVSPYSPLGPVLLGPGDQGPLYTTGWEPPGTNPVNQHGHYIPQLGTPNSTNPIDGYHRHIYELEPDNPLDPSENWGDHVHSVEATLKTIPSHTHVVYAKSVAYNGDHSHPGQYTINPSNTPTDFVNDHSHTFSINPAGTTATNRNLPPFYAIAYIMKL